MGRISLSPLYIELLGCFHQCIYIHVMIKLLPLLNGSSHEFDFDSR
ncbi:hypothetical protein J2T13_002890 [Paenibacillus sp. DS2015]